MKKEEEKKQETNKRLPILILCPQILTIPIEPVCQIERE
tara:strand:- start:547 stop:663 length:117 start_codon:yes stop_codon:yes gene_type:complete